MAKSMIEFLKEITTINGVPGNEKLVRNYMAEEMKDFADEITYDNLGSVIAKKVGNPEGPKVLIGGHLDEVGFMVTKITDEGFIKIIPLGGWWSQNVLSQQWTITTTAGKQVHAVSGAKPPHILKADDLKKPFELDNIFLDIGVVDKEEAEKLGIKVGDMVTPFIEFKVMANPNYLLAKAWDNRIGCAIAIDVLKSLKEQKHENIYYAVGAVQEEVGLRGAQTSGFKINPDIAIAADVSIAYDYPGGEKERGEMGKGPQILIYDSSTIGHKGLRDFVIEIAEKNNIPYQLGYLQRGGTDAGRFHQVHDGAPAMSLAICSRYIHSHTSMIHKEDYINAVKLMTEVVKELNKDNVQEIIFK